jgi:hypothetical protein
MPEASPPVSPPFPAAHDRPPDRIVFDANPAEALDEPRADEEPLESRCFGIGMDAAQGLAEPRPHSAPSRMGDHPPGEELGQDREGLGRARVLEEGPPAGRIGG